MSAQAELGAQNVVHYALVDGGAIGLACENASAVRPSRALPRKKEKGTEKGQR